MFAELAFLLSYALLIFMKIVCFLLGYLTVRLGYKLIDSGAKGDFKFSASLGGVKTDLASVSPGLLFVALGVFLIGYAIYINKEIHFKPVDFNPSSIAAVPEVELPTTSPFSLGKQPPFKGEKGVQTHESN